MNPKALHEAHKQLEELETLMSTRAQVWHESLRHLKELDARIVAVRGTLAVAIALARTEQ